MPDLESRVAALEQWARAHDHDPLPPAEPPPDPDPEPEPPAVSDLTATGQIREGRGFVTLAWSGPAEVALFEVNTPGGLGTIARGRGDVRGPLGDLQHVYRYWLVVDGQRFDFPAVTLTPAPDPEPDPTPAGPPRGTVLFASDFGRGLAGFAAIQTAPTGDDRTPQPVPGHIELVPDPAGGTVCRVIRPANGRERSELLPGAACDVRRGDTRLVSWRMRFARDFPAPRGRWCIVYQQHAGQFGPDGPPAFAIEVVGSDLVVNNHRRRSDGATRIGPVDRGVWHRYDVAVRFDTAGWVQVWRDGVQVVERTERVTWPADYAKFGLYLEAAVDRGRFAVEFDDFVFARL